ncbi:peptide ABC transporter substrate-binding protein, partial [Brachyspira pilosicoli]
MTYNLKTKNFFIKTLFQTFFIFLIFLLIISCTKETKKIKDELTVNLGYELQSIDPAINDETYGFIYINHAFEGLLTKDINGKIVGGSS